MLRKIVEIDQKKCNGCGLCVDACHEGAIVLGSNNKAELIRDDYCDGLGDCLPVCPTGAITILEREAAAYDEKAVQAKKAAATEEAKTMACGCLRSSERKLDKSHTAQGDDQNCTPHSLPSQLSQWPVQIKLVSANASYFDEARLLVAADCTAYAYGDFHQTLIKDHITVIGCPKLDNEDYSVKLTEILKHHAIQEITVARMEVPCCGGMETAVKTAVKNSQKDIPVRVVTISAEGKII